jgi:hypothetical protein
MFHFNGNPSKETSKLIWEFQIIYVLKFCPPDDVYGELKDHLDALKPFIFYCPLVLPIPLFVISVNTY